MEIILKEVFMNLFFSEALAQEATKAAAQPNPIASLAPFVLIFLVFYFLMIKPQKKKLQQEQALLGAIKKGDEVYTKAGIIGTVYGVTDKIITLEIADGVKMKVLKAQIGGLAASLFETKEKSAKAAKAKA